MEEFLNAYTYQAEDLRDSLALLEILEVELDPYWQHQGILRVGVVSSYKVRIKKSMLAFNHYRTIQLMHNSMFRLLL